MENIIVYYSTSSQRTEITNPDICRLKKKPLSVFKVKSVVEKSQKLNAQTQDQKKTTKQITQKRTVTTTDGKSCQKEQTFLGTHSLTGRFLSACSRE